MTYFTQRAWPTRFTLRSGVRASTLLTAALLVGCASQPDRYYTLSSPVDAAPLTAVGGLPLTIEVAPVSLPERLARPQMVVRANAPLHAPGAEVKVLEQHRWASSFEIELRDALAGGIASRLGAIDASRTGRRPQGPEGAQGQTWRIAVQVRQFDAIEGGRVDAEFSWSVRRSDADLGPNCQWRVSESAGPDVAALAMGAQRVTAGLAELISRQVRALQADPAAGCVNGSKAT